MQFIFIIAILIMSVVIHEVAHGYAALALGDETAKYQGRLTLNPLSHLDLMGSIIVPLLGYIAGGFIIGWAKPVPFNPYNLSNQKWGEALVAVAGPVSNLCLAIVFGSILRFVVPMGILTEPVIGLLVYIVLINITLAVFNLVPIAPLDGSKILFSILPYRWNFIREYMERLGILFVLVFIFVFWQVISPVITYLFKVFTGVAF